MFPPPRSLGRRVVETFSCRVSVSLTGWGPVAHSRLSVAGLDFSAGSFQTQTDRTSPPSHCAVLPAWRRRTSQHRVSCPSDQQTVPVTAPLVQGSDPFTAALTCVQPPRVQIRVLKDPCGTGGVSEQPVSGRICVSSGWESAGHGSSSANTLAPTCLRRVRSRVGGLPNRAHRGPTPSWPLARGGRCVADPRDCI